MVNNFGWQPHTKQGPETIVLGTMAEPPNNEAAAVLSDALRCPGKGGGAVGRAVPPPPGAELFLRTLGGSSSPGGNRHLYPVLNPDGEMAYAYYEELCGWQFDRDFKRSTRMLWLDIEKILPKEDCV